jgi:hypothetical protein
MHTVGRHGCFGNITVLVEDTPLISLTDQLGCAGAPLRGVEGLQGVVELGVVKFTWEAAGGFWVGVGGPTRGRCPPHVICTVSMDMIQTLRQVCIDRSIARQLIGGKNRMQLRLWCHALYWRPQQHSSLHVYVTNLSLVLQQWLVRKPTCTQC